jgi:HAD superfamily hydrolase (TIGR01509 family)
MIEGTPIQALIFDLDGLLVDSEPTWFEVEGGFLAELGHTWTREQAEACMGQGTPNTLRIWRERYGVQVDIPRDTERIIDRMVARADGMALKKGALHLLDRARQRGCPMAVASSSPKRLIVAVLAAKGIDAYFRAVVSGQEVPRGKPAPDVFLRAAELLGVEAPSCVVLEDTLAGTRAGVAAGARVVAIPTVDAEGIASLATWVLRDLDEAGDVLFGADAHPRQRHPARS